MPPKNKGKKGKKQDDDEFWEKGAQTVTTQLATVSLDEDGTSSNAKPSKSGFSSFAALQDDDDPMALDDGDDGGLMSVIKSNSAKSKKDKKKGKKEAVSFADAVASGEGESDEEQAAPKSKKALEMTADELADEEFGPLKKKGKKGKKDKAKAVEPADEDEITEATPTPTQMTAEELAEEEFGPSKKKGKKGKKDKAKVAEPEDEEEPVPDSASAPTQMTAEELADEEFGPTKKKGKKGKKDKGKTAEPEEEDEPPKEEPVEVPQPPPQMTAEELADEEFGPTKKKGKKGKKDKGGKIDADEATEPAEKAEETPAAATPQDADADDDDLEAPGRVLTKKEKEKLKKERDKAKKKAQAAAKKEAVATEEPAETEPTPAPAQENEPKDQDDDDGDAGAEGGAASKKKKKKKPAKKDEPPPKPAKKKAAGGVSALRAMMEERKRLEEEAKKKEEEERLRIEEEERKAAEEEKRKEEEKLRKKEKEKAKRELAKKEGRLLTKKQKEERAMAEIRKQALLDSGVVIEGLQQPASGSQPKKVVYGKRQRKPAAKTENTNSQPEPTSKPEPEAPAVEESKAEDEPKSDWDAGSDEEPPKAQPAVPAATAPKSSVKETSKTATKDDEEVKSDWDESSDDGKEESTPAAVSKVNGKPPVIKSGASKANGTASAATQPKSQATAPAKATPPTKAAPATKAAANGKTTAAATKAAPTKVAAQEEEESSSEEDSSEDDSSEDDSDSDSDDSSDSDGMTAAQRQAAQRKAEAAARRQQRHEEAMAARNKDDLRSPICCILGHVDTGKTKLLDKIRQTNVQEGEAGGITQQIGATYFPVDAIKQKTAVLNTDGKAEYKIPGLLVIDTPGHESFTNLRSRGSSLCNIAILVVDIMHGLEPQTLESLRLLRDRKTPFIVALNKIDRMYGWVATPDNSFQDSLKKQPTFVQREFEDRVQKTIVAFAEQGLNAVLYYENKNLGRNVSLVPTSAITGEGVPDMIMLLVKLTQERMSDRLMYLSELECTVLEVKVIEGLGTTIDVVLSNGILREGDKIIVCGLNGPISTQIRALLTPQPLRELRVKSAYVHHKEVKAALGIKIAAPDLEKAIAGSRLLVCGPDDDEEEMMEEVMSDLTSLLESIDKSGRGVYVQASTLGSLEALLDFLKSSKIPVSGINIGPVHKKDIIRCGTMLEKAKELACVLAFDVEVDREAEKLATEQGIRIFKADIIYHLFDAFKAYNAEITEAKQRDMAPRAIWPCRLKIIAVFAKRDPIILGVDILEGSLRLGTPLCAVKVDPVTQKREIIDLGKITSLEINHKNMDIVKKAQAGGGVAVKIESAVYQATRMFGRHFDDKDELVSHITRDSIDVLKATFKDDVAMDEWLLIKSLKPRLGIQ